MQIGTRERLGTEGGERADMTEMGIEGGCYWKKLASEMGIPFVRRSKVVNLKQLLGKITLIRSYIIFAIIVTYGSNFNY